MTWGKADADYFIPDGATLEVAMERATMLAIGAHPDDIEILAVPGILKAFQAGGNQLFGLVATTGGGTLRSVDDAELSYLEMRETRTEEQKQAASLGQYSGVVLLNYGSAEIKDACYHAPDKDLQAVIQAVRPREVYMHNPFDRHDTHVAVCMRGIAALRAVAAQTGWMPQHVYGCEAWRGLDWLVHCDRTALPVHDPNHLSDRLLRVYKSQFLSEKQYDLAARGRRIVNATYQESQALGSEHEMAFAVDLMPLLEDPTIAVSTYVKHTIDRFRADSLSRLDRYSVHGPCSVKAE